MEDDPARYIRLRAQSMLDEAYAAAHLEATRPELEKEILEGSMYGRIDQVRKALTGGA
jgi:hypothetical protein